MIQKVDSKLENHWTNTMIIQGTTIRIYLSIDTHANSIHTRLYKQATVIRIAIEKSKNVEKNKHICLPAEHGKLELISRILCMIIIRVRK